MLLCVNMCACTVCLIGRMNIFAGLNETHYYFNSVMICECEHLIASDFKIGAAETDRFVFAEGYLYGVIAFIMK